MPVSKPSSLIERHETAAEKAERVARENALRPKGMLPKDAPARLKAHPVAAEAWRRLMRTWGEVEGEVVTRLDFDLLVDYCLLIEQIGELDEMRRVAFELWKELGQEHKRLKEEDPENAVAVAIETVGAFEAVIKLDARGERKRAHLQKLREALYLTPRSRAGAAPKRKEKALPDEFEEFLDGVE